MQNLLSTTDFANAVGISESTVRRIADGGELRIQRTKGGHRKIPIAEAIRYIRDSNLKLIKPEILGLSTPILTEDSNDSDRLLAALREGNAVAVIELLRTMYASGNSLAEICDGPVRNAMALIGASWPEDKRSIFVEHRATLICVRALCQIRLSLPEPISGAPTAIGCAPQDDPYLLPSMMVSLVLHEAGMVETNLGPNTPIDVLTDSIEDEQPDLVWLAITNPIRSRQHQRDIETLADYVESYGGKLIVGGQQADSFDGGSAFHCDSMRELRQRAIDLVDDHHARNGDKSSC